MLADPLTLEEGGSYVPLDMDNQVFSAVKQEPSGITRLNVATDLTLPEYLVIRHAVQGKADKLIDRHLVQFSRVERDTVTGLLHTQQVNLTIVVPRTSLFTLTEVRRQLRMMSHLLIEDTDANLGKVLRGES